MKQAETSWPLAPSGGNTLRPGPVASFVLLLAMAAATARADLTASPATLTLAPGEESPPIQLTVVNAVPSLGPASLSVMGLPPGASTRPFPVTVNLSRTGTGNGSFRIATSTATPPGEYVVSLSGPPALRVGSTMLRLTVVPPSVFVEPSSVTLVPGTASPPLSIRVANVGGGEIAFAVSLPGALLGLVSVEPNPVRVPIAPAARSGSASFRLVAAPSTPAGSYVVGLRDPVSGLAASVSVVVRPAVKILTVAPSALATGSPDILLRLTGEGFEPGARLVGSDPTLLFGSVRVFSAGLLEATVSVRNDAAPGPREVTLLNPDGGTARTRIAVLPADSLAAPLTVRTAAVVHPAPGSLLGADEALRPRGVLAVAGTGIVVGTWQLDGVPFERFSVPARGGQPVAVEASMPIPRTAPGEHQLQLTIETPQRLTSPAVTVVLVTRRASQLRLLFPRDRAVLARPPFVFRWSSVPGALGYELEFLGGDGRAPIRLSTVVPHWEPVPGLLAPGVHRWRVRPVFPGGVRGEPTEARRIAVLPEAVELRIVPTGSGKTSSLEWEGGSPGLLYRVDLLGKENDQVLLSALVVRPGYALPAALLDRSWPVRARVTALAPGGISRGRSAVVELALPPVTSLLVAAGPSPHILDRRPSPSSSVSTMHPVIAAEWDAALAATEVTLVVDDVDVTAVARQSEHGVEYRSLLPLAPGPHEVSLVLGDAVVRWTFRVDATAAAEESPAAPPAEPEPAWTREVAGSSSWGDWGIAVDGTVTFTTGDQIEDQWTGRASLSGQVDVDGEGGFVRAAGDLSASTGNTAEGFVPSTLENRNWTITAGPRQGPYREEASVGYAPPTFLSGSELLSGGLARGGVQGTLAGPAVEMAYYETFDSDYAGVVTGTYAPAQRLRAAGLTLGRRGGRFGLRLLGLQTREDASAFSAGGEGRVYGFFGTFRPRPAWTLFIEGARGELDPGPSGFGSPREGYAVRFGVTGTAGPWGLRLNLRNTDAGFVNPANSGLTPGSISDRSGGDVELTRAFGSSFLRLAYSHLEGGGGLGLAAAQGRQDGGQAQIDFPLGTAVSVHLGGGYTATRSDGDPLLPLPPTDQTDTTVQLQVSERLGGFSLGQNASYQSTEDALDPLRRNEVSAGGISLAGPIGQHLNLFANATATRVEGDPAFGRTDSILVAVQPSLSFAGAGLSLLPYASFSRTSNDVLATESEITSYQLTVLWNPRLWQSLFSLQASADWTRVSAGNQPSAGFVARYTFGITLRRDVGSGGLASPLVPTGPRPRLPGLPPATAAGPTGTIS